MRKGGALQGSNLLGILCGLLHCEVPRCGRKQLSRAFCIIFWVVHNDWENLWVGIPQMLNPFQGGGAFFFILLPHPQAESLTHLSMGKALCMALQGSVDQLVRTTRDRAWDNLPTLFYMSRSTASLWKTSSYKLQKRVWHGGSSLQSHA